MRIEFGSRPQRALGDAYTIQREPGSGGMATVFLAREKLHDWLVAVKVLRPEMAKSVGTQRFLHEISVAAQLHHPHILPVHDHGETPDGRSGTPCRTCTARRRAIHSRRTTRGACGRGRRDHARAGALAR